MSDQKKFIITEIKSWGIDIGNVIFQGNVIRNSISYKEEWTKENVKIIDGTIKAIASLVKKVGSDNVWIISKASIPQQERSLKLFDHYDIYTKTGLKQKNIKFCLNRLDKFPIIKNLKLEGHIDDRGEVIHSIQELVKFPIWFNPEKTDYDKWNLKINLDIPIVRNWSEINVL